MKEKSSTVNIIHESSVVRGNIRCDGDIRIDGRVCGHVWALGKVVVGINGFIEGDIMAESADIFGEVIGKMVVKETLWLKASANLLGDIEVTALVVDKGAKFMGGCKMVLDMVNAIQEFSSDVSELNGTNH